MSEDPYDKIIQLLEEVKKRTFSFVGPLNEGKTPTIRTFLDGVNAICWYLDIQRQPYSSKAYEEIVISRGWEYSPRGIWDEMREKGKSEQEITVEMLEIEIELWKRSKLKAMNGE